MQHRPLLAWIVAFVAGVGAWSAAGPHAPAIALALGALGVVLIAVAGARRAGLAAAGILLTGFAAGALRMGAFESLPQSDISHWAGRTAPVTVVGTIAGDPQPRPGRTTLILSAEQVQTGAGTAAVTGQVAVDVLTAAQTGPPLDYGERVALSGRLDIPADATNPGAFSWRGYLARRAIDCELRVKRAGAVTVLGAGRANPLLRLAWRVRARVVAAVDSSLPRDQAAVLCGILLGRRADLPPDLMADFVHTGTVHILASAGLHVGILALCLLALCERLTLPRKATALLIIVTLCWYACACGGRPAVVRAVLMAALYFGAILFERVPDLPTAVGCAALFVLFAQPTALLESGFQLSFLTVLTLAIAMPVWERLFRPRLDAWIDAVPQRRPARKPLWWLIELLGVTLFAQVGAAPIVAADYNIVAVTGLLANLLVVPLLFALIPLGFLGAALGCLWHPAGPGLFALTGEILKALVWTVRTLGESPWAYRALPSPPALALAAYYGLVVCCAFLLRGRPTPRVRPAAAP